LVGLPVNNYKIFELLGCNSNCKISKLSKNSKNELINYINEYYLELRNTIDMNNKDTFGFEMEAEVFKYSKIYDLMNRYGFDLSRWVIKPDLSLYKGYEVVTPILNKNSVNFEEIDYICDIVKNNSKVGIHASSHIHIGAHTLNNDKEVITRLIILLCAYENVLYRFAYGEFLNERPGITTYASPCSESWYEMLSVFKNYSYLSSFERIKWLSCNDKNKAINLTNVKSLDEIKDKNTIEFRLFNYTLNPIIWQNNYNLVSHFIKYCNSDLFDYDTVLSRIETNKSNFNNLEYYRRIDCSGAIEFADLIFDKNIDKVYFLRQYLKNMEETTSEYLKPAKQFTKIKLEV